MPLSESPSRPASIGREQEEATIVAAVADARHSGRALIVEGEAGIGKSTLLEHAVSAATDQGFRVIRCAGAQGTTSIGYGGLHELLHPLYPFIDYLPERQKHALSTAFALEEGPVPDRLVVGLAALSLLEEASAGKPLLVAIEDLQWLDRSSVDVLMFLVSRLSEAKVLMLGTLRVGGDVDFLSPAAVERIALGPLDAESADLLLREAEPRLTDATRARILRESDGNPLALLELPVALREHGIRSTAMYSRLPATRKLERAFLDQLDSVPEASRRFLVLAAAADGAGVHDVMDAARRLDLSVDDLRPLEERGLITVTDNDLRFRHALLRSAVQSAATMTEWVACHLALAAATTGTQRSVWHRAAAAVERDESLATELESAAGIARDRGAHAESAQAFSRAATLSPGRRNRARRIALAAETARAGGLTSEAVELLAQIDTADIDPRVIAEITFTKIGLSLTAGAITISRAEIAAVLQQLPVESYSDERMKILWGAAVIARGRNLPRDYWEQLLELIDATPSSSPMKSIARAVLTPLGEIASLRVSLPSLVPRLLDLPIELVSLGIAAESFQDLETAMTAYDIALERSHELGASAEVVQALRGRANILLLTGRLREGLADAEYAERLSVDTSQPLMGSVAAATAARARVLLGDIGTARDDLERSLRLSGSAPLSFTGADARWAAGLAALVMSDYRLALIEFTHMSLHSTRALWAIADRTEAAVRAGRASTVIENIAEADRAARAYRSPYLSSLVARSLALTSEGEEARRQYVRAIELGSVSESRLELARSRLVFGEWLRRERHVSDAREQLELAVQEFTSCGAVFFAERAGSELRAAGGQFSSSASARTASELLTPQELQVARLAAQGMTNKEIADAVYLSHRTVSTHLYRAYPKLGIAARRQLADALQAGGYE